MESLIFNFSKTPAIYFGTGKINLLPKIVSYYGNNILLFLSCSFSKTASCIKLQKDFKNSGIFFESILSSGEPSPDFVDEICLKYRDRNISAVVSIGGGSVIDAGKAVSAMLNQTGSVMDYLEGIGTKTPKSKEVPFIAVPTTSGTGSEGTKNAVLSKVSEDGFKRSLRHDSFMPDAAVIDPELTITCSREVTAACGLDALTQLIEAYVSTNASPFTDALCEIGLKHFKEGFNDALTDGNNKEARASLSLASLTSGIVLANAGLGLVHGFASPIGGFFNIPHGVVCGKLLYPVTSANINLLKNSSGYIFEAALVKYGKAGEILSGKQTENIDEASVFLLKYLEKITALSSLKNFSSYGVKDSDLIKIAEHSSNKNSPAKLSKDDMINILKTVL